jgi:glycerophosphodiester phosphodiesterase
MGALLELRGQLRKLQWYAELNRQGFVKITKKLGKKTGRTDFQQRYLVTKVDGKAFAANFRLSQDLRAINDWLSALGDAKIVDDASSVASAGSLRRVSSRVILKLPSGLLDTVELAIRNDDAAILEESLFEANSTDGDTEVAFQKLLLNLLQRAISCRSSKCIHYLLQRINNLDEEDDINNRNCLHRLVISISRAKTNEFKASQHAEAGLSVAASQYILPAESPASLAPSARHCAKENNLVLRKDDESVRLLTYVLDELNSKQRLGLAARDAYGRLPLHYAAQYGFVAIVEIVVKHMQDWGQFNVQNGIDAPEWQDQEGLAPLHLCVINQHPLATKSLLTAEKWQDTNPDLTRYRKRSSKSGEVLALAAKTNSVLIVQLLVGAGVDVNFQDEQGDSALHVAARFGHTECAKALLDPGSGQKAQVDLPEKTFAWTPMFIACVDGHLPIVDLLVEAGADLERLDASGWTAKEHAALRGHFDIAQRLAEFTPAPPSPSTEALSVASTSSSPPNALSLEERRSGFQANKDAVLAKEPQPVKTFGHRYLTKETMILVSLGSMDVKQGMNPVKLDAIPLANAHATQLDTALSVVVSASGATGEPTVIDLPVQENISTEPITFMTTDITNVKLLFDIVPTYAASKEKTVGRGVAMLSSIRPNIGSKRISLQGDLSVPIIAATTLDVIGSVHFNFLVITPFHHPNISISEDHTYWKRMASTMVIGHRGLGKNMNTRNSLQLGENTIQSFIAAANLGASYVEFDVQLTKDHVPVIYHDFLVGETGFDAPVHTLTLEQFLHASNAQTPRPSRPASPEHTLALPGMNGPGPVPGRRMRSYSVGGSKEDRQIVPDMSDRMKHTRAFKEKGFKANTRGNFIQAPFTTLEEMFNKLPEDIGFNIEMKYPRLDEAEEHDMDTYAVELNSFVDSVLTKVYDLCRNRNIIFSTFHPDICLLLSFKQPSIPILFLTDAGTSPTRDIRASSLQEAIRFASRWNLLGVVSAAEPLVTCPRLVRVVKESGLVCVSYGTLNNDPKNVQVSFKSICTKMINKADRFPTDSSQRRNRRCHRRQRTRHPQRSHRSCKQSGTGRN